MPVKVGIIGAGYIGALHANILTKDERVKIAGVYDIVSERAAALASSVGAEAVNSVEQLIDSADAVYITTPNTQHVGLVLSALEAGRHVFSEKPMATELDGARKILEASRQSRGIYQLGHNRRFAPVYKFVKKLITEGQIMPHSAHIKMNRGELQNPPWVGDSKVTGGFLYETTIHLLDMALWLFGDVKRIDVRARACHYNDFDNFSMLISFAGGMFATFASSADASWYFPFERLEIFGGHATVETQEMERVSCVLGLGREIVTQDFYQLTKEQKWGYAEEDHLFITSILDDAPGAVTALDGYKSVELVEACYRSARTGEAVDLPLNSIQKQ